jgi:hypothetical protein
VTKLKAALTRLRYTEPALLRAHIVAILALLAGLGITVPGVVDRWVGVALTVAAILAPYYQGVRTRADVWSPQTVDDLTALIAAFPGLAEHAKELLDKGISPGIAREVLELAASTAAVPPPASHSA